MIILCCGYSILTQEVCNWWSLLPDSLIFFIYFLLLFLFCCLFVCFGQTFAAMASTWHKLKWRGFIRLSITGVAVHQEGRAWQSVAAHINTKESRVKMPASTDPLLMPIYSVHAPVYGMLNLTFRLYLVPLVNESGNALPEIHRGHVLLITYEFLNSIGLTFKNNPHNIQLYFPSYWKLILLTQYILIIVSPPSIPPSSSTPPLPHR